MLTEEIDETESEYDSLMN